MINFFKKHWEVLSYLVFGVLCTLLNIVLYALFNKLFGYTAANSWGNVLDNIICILFAYCTNRAFVFRSKTQGKAMAREFGAFVTCRLGTMLLDTAIMLVLGNLLENALRASERLPETMRRVSVICHMLSPAMMGLIVENRYDGQLSRREGKLLSTSHPGFGTGLLSVETVAKKYHGQMTVETENGVFRVNVLLNL